MCWCTSATWGAPNSVEIGVRLAWLRGQLCLRGRRNDGGDVDDRTSINPWARNGRDDRLLKAGAA
jgi:hypothetical protein